MNDDAPIEHLLQSLTPAQPSADLTKRVERDLALAAMFRDSPPAAAAGRARPPAARWYAPVTWALLGAAAAVLVMSALPPAIAPSSPAKNATAAVLPVNNSREWVGVEEGGISFDQQASPQRQLRVHAVERHQWVDPRTGAEYTVEEPVTGSVTLPVKFQ